MSRAIYRSQLSIRTLLLATVGMLTLLITMMVVRESYVEWQKLEQIKALKTATRIGDQLFDATEKMTIERDIAFSILHTQDPQSLIVLELRLKDSREQVDAALDNVLANLKRYNFKEINTQSEEVSTQFGAFKVQRKLIDEAMAVSMDKRSQALSVSWFKDSTAMILQVQGLWMSFIKRFSNIDSYVALHMRYKHFLGIIMEYTGRERALIGRLIVENKDPTPQEQAELLRWQGAVELAWGRIGTLADKSGLYTTIEPYIKDAQSHYQTVYSMIGDSFYTPGAKHGASYPISVELWLEVASQANDSLYALKSATVKTTSAYIDSLEENARRAIGIHAALMMFTLLICAYSFWIITRRVINPVNQIIEALINTMQGKHTPLILETAGRDDEIGKLAQVLHVLQQNVDEIKRYTKDLERSNKELDDFAYIASHDLKEPLRGLHNHARFLLEDNEDKLDPESVNRLNRLIYLSQRMERLVNDLLYFSRLGRQDLAIQPTDLNLVIHDIIDTLELLLTERNAHINVPRPLPTITCDKTRVTELFRNLITNAVKYNDKVNKMLEIGYLESYPYKDGTILNHVFFVRDNGIGISAEFHEEVFRIFKRLQSAKDKQEEGTGVGLTFVRKIVERHGGKIWLESTPGNGTTFYFTLEE